MENKLFELIVNEICKLCNEANIKFRTCLPISYSFQLIWFDSPYFIQILYDDSLNWYYVEFRNRFLDTNKKLKITNNLDKKKLKDFFEQIVIYIN